MNKRHYEHTLPNIRGSLSNTYLFPENYSFTERKNFTRNALQSDEIKRGSPNLRLENQPAMAGTRPDKRQEEWIERGNAALQL